MAIVKQSLAPPPEKRGLVAPAIKMILGGKFKKASNCAKHSLLPSRISNRSETTTSRRYLSLCKVVRFKLDEMPTNPGSVCIEELALMCDRYQCLRVEVLPCIVVT